MSKLRCPSMNGNSDCPVMMLSVGIPVPVGAKQSMNIFISSSSSERGNNVAVILKINTMKKSPNESS